MPPTPQTKTTQASKTSPSAEETLEGKTIQWTFDDGPTKGTTYEHTFNADGSVEYGSVKDGKAGKKARVGECATVKVGPDVFLVSYISEGGYTLTVALNFADHTAVAFASNESDWSQQSGTFEVVHAGARDTGRSTTNRPKAKSS